MLKSSLFLYCFSNLPKNIIYNEKNINNETGSHYNEIMTDEKDDEENLHMEHILGSTPNSLENYVDVSLVDLVTKQLRHDIYVGRYQAGQKLIVREISENLNVSHTPIKEALNRLVSEGYVTAQPRKSMIVKEYTNQQFIESMQLRLIIELVCTGDFLEAVRNDASVIREMKRYQQLQAELSSADAIDFEAWVECGGKFHDVYMCRVRNRQMYETYNNLDTNRGSYFAYMRNSNAPFLRRRVLQDAAGHDAIITAMEQQDEQKLKRALVKHVRDACSDYLIDDDAKRVYAALASYLGAEQEQ